MAVTRALYSGLLDSRKFRNAVALSAFIDGGTKTVSGGYTIHTFTSIGNNTYSVFADNPSVEYLVVAGGGQGGITGSTYAQGGGGAGGYRTGSINLSRGSNQVLSVGVGGTGATNTNLPATNGSNSIFSNITSIGGGGGGGATQSQGSTSDYGASGGSGGGGGGTRGGSNAGAAGTAGQGNAGGNGNWVSRYPNAVDVTFGGGGGGAAASGANAQYNAALGPGGAGAVNTIGGSSVTYAAGAPGNGGNIGAFPVSGPAASNTGNGGPAGNGPGGSGIVIFRYPTPI